MSGTVSFSTLSSTQNGAWIAKAAIKAGLLALLIAAGTVPYAEQKCEGMGPVKSTLSLKLPEVQPLARMPVYLSIPADLAEAWLKSGADPIAQ